MRVRISYTVEVSDYTRRQINAYYGQPGLASRQDVQAWFRTYGSSMDDDLSYGMDTAWTELGPRESAEEGES